VPERVEHLPVGRGGHPQTDLLRLGFRAGLGQAFQQGAGIGLQHDIVRSQQRGEPLLDAKRFGASPGLLVAVGGDPDIVLEIASRALRRLQGVVGALAAGGQPALLGLGALDGRTPSAARAAACAVALGRSPG